MENIVRYCMIILIVFTVVSCTNDIISPPFTNEEDPPQVSTTEIIAVSKDSAFVSGRVEHQGGAGVFVRGFIWGITEELSLENYLGITENNVGAGNFTAVLKPLEKDTPYFVRAYATNIFGTSYGKILSFKTLLEDPIVEMDEEDPINNEQPDDEADDETNDQAVPDDPDMPVSDADKPTHF
jgi:hypothetical protein